MVDLQHVGSVVLIQPDGLQSINASTINWGVQTTLRDNHPRGTELFDPTSYPYYEQYLIKTDSVRPYGEELLDGNIHLA